MCVLRLVVHFHSGFAGSFLLPTNLFPENPWPLSSCQPLQRSFREKQNPAISSDMTKAKQRALQPKDAAGPGFGSWNPRSAACNTATAMTAATVPGDSLPGIGPSSMGVLDHSVSVIGGALVPV